MMPYLSYKPNGLEMHNDTTVSYLTIPCQLATDQVGDSDGYETDGYFHADTSLCSLIDPSSLVLTDEQRLRFNRAKKVLALKPYVHVTQLQNTVSAASETPAVHRPDGRGRSAQCFHGLPPEAREAEKKRVSERASGEWLRR